jgi:hypothetical protein
MIVRTIVNSDRDFAVGAVLARKTLYATEQKCAKAASEAVLTRRRDGFTRE